MGGATAESRAGRSGRSPSIERCTSALKTRRLGQRPRSRFAQDSPLEEAVTSEPVSEAKFPASWENTGLCIIPAKLRPPAMQSGFLSSLLSTSQGRHVLDMFY